MLVGASSVDVGAAVLVTGRSVVAGAVLMGGAAVLV